VIRAARAFPWARDVILHEFGNPTLTDLYLTPASWHEHASSVVAELFPRRSVHEFADEFTPVMEMIRGRVDERRAMLRYPDYSAIEEETARLLYSLVRVAQPETVLETGVGNGVSSAIFLVRIPAGICTSLIAAHRLTPSLRKWAISTCSSTTPITATTHRWESSSPRGATYGREGC
jgi:hypothetical protein